MAVSLAVSKIEVSDFMRRMARSVSMSRSASGPELMQETYSLVSMCFIFQGDELCFLWGTDKVK